MRSLKIFTILAALLFASNCFAADNSYLPVNWNSDSIGIADVQRIISQNTNFKNFGIKFPNGYVWNVNSLSLQNLYSNYQKQAKSLGYKKLPDLSFSSVPSQIKNSASSLTLPVEDAVDKMQSFSDNAMRELRYKQLSISSSLPDWLKTVLLVIYNGFISMYDFCGEKIRQWF